MKGNSKLAKYKEYVVNYPIKPVRPSDKAKILISYDIKIAYDILSQCGITENKIEAIKLVASGLSYLEVSKQFNCSADTIRDWINKAYKEVLKIGNS